MDDLFPQPERPLDRLVRGQLDRDADHARADELWKRANQRPRLLAWLPQLAAVAAVLLVGLVLFWPSGRAFATPAEAVKAAYRTHIDDQGADRHYRLQVAFSPGFKARFPRMKDRETDLWTRGDRFRVEPGPAGGVWGQDE